MEYRLSGLCEYHTRVLSEYNPGSTLVQSVLFS